MKKAELLQTALKMMKRQLKAGGVELPTGEVVVLDLDEARALVEALGAIMWSPIYKNEERYEIGLYYETFEEADTIGRLSKDEKHIETVGIIRLKSDEQ